jgi:hypothetical protein
LTSITIPDGVTMIQGATCRACDSLTSITIPSSVTYICTNAFYSNSNSMTVHCEGTTPPTLQSSIFNNKPLAIYVPDESVAAYKTAWSKYADRIVSANEE